MNYDTISYMCYLIVGILFYLFIFEKYYSVYKTFRPSRLYLYVIGSVVFFPSAILLELFRTIKK